MERIILLTFLAVLWIAGGAIIFSKKKSLNPTKYDRLFFSWIDTALLIFSAVFFSLQICFPKAEVQSVDLDTVIVASFILLIITSALLWRLMSTPHRAFRLPRAKISACIRFIVAGLLGFIAFYLIYQYSGLLELVQKITDSPLEQNSVQLLKSGPPSVRIAIAVSALLVAPIAEETIFRGLIYGYFRKHTCSIPIAIAMNSIFFGLAHEHMTSFIPLTIFACVLSYAYEKTGKLWVPIAIHALFNGSSILSALLISSS